METIILLMQPLTKSQVAVIFRLDNIILFLAHIPYRIAMNLIQSGHSLWSEYHLISVIIYELRALEQAQAVQKVQQMF